ncbi:hypothetical protein HDU88_004377 [Geranomyces variabilis]|nr:hypothetical protein HDU88_004377 [Geranomyces variabilis]
MADHYHDDDAFVPEPIKYVPPSAAAASASPAVSPSAPSSAAVSSPAAVPATGPIDSGVATPVDRKSLTENNTTYNEGGEDDVSPPTDDIPAPPLPDKDSVSPQPQAISTTTTAGTPTRAATLSQFESQKIAEARQRSAEAELAKQRHEAEMFEKARVLRLKLQQEENLRREAEDAARREEEAARQQVLAKQKAKMAEFEQQKKEAAARADEQRKAELKAKEQEAFAKLELAKQKTQQEEKARREEAERKLQAEHLARAEKLRKQEEAMARFEEERRVKQMSEPARAAYLAKKAKEAAAIQKAQDEERERLAAIEKAKADEEARILEESRAREAAAAAAAEEAADRARLASLPVPVAGVDKPLPALGEKSLPAFPNISQPSEELDEHLDEATRLARQKSRDALLAAVAERARLEAVRVRQESEARNAAAAQTEQESAARIQREMDAALRENGGSERGGSGTGPKIRYLDPETLEERAAREKQEQIQAEREAEEALKHALERKKTVKELADLDADAWRADLMQLMAAEEANSRADQAKRVGGNAGVLPKDADVASTLSVPRLSSVSARPAAVGRPSMAIGRQSMSVERAQAFQQQQNGARPAKKSGGGCSCTIQ